MMWFHRLANFLLRLILRTLLRLTIQDMENTPATDTLIVAINHASFLDPLLTGAFLPRTIMPLSKAELFKTPLFGWVFPAYGAIPVHRDAVDRQAIRQSLALLRRGDALLVAPEGTRSEDGQLQRGRSGIALLAARTDATILPVAIWGTQSFWRNLSRLRRTEVHMAVGEPFRIAMEGRRIPREQLDAITDEIMYHLAELMPPEYRGVYENLDQATEKYLERR
ncbi:MAG: 1-acyl-sn-glycerol-3-phosphate acyltransferase [Anaerolineales bacterium]|nr:1-acyl-sn-glycerol-3-phosphate acyltransferase [Anaerolineales bacterium]